MGKNAKKPFECTMQYTCDLLLIASTNASGLNCIVVDIALIELVFDLPCDRSIDRSIDRRSNIIEILFQIFEID